MSPRLRLGEQHSLFVPAHRFHTLDLDLHISPHAEITLSSWKRLCSCCKHIRQETSAGSISVGVPEAWKLSSCKVESSCIHEKRGSLAQGEGTGTPVEVQTSRLVLQMEDMAFK